MIIPALKQQIQTLINAIDSELKKEPAEQDTSAIKAIETIQNKFIDLPNAEKEGYLDVLKTLFDKITDLRDMQENYKLSLKAELNQFNQHNKALKAYRQSTLL